MKLEFNQQILQSQVEVQESTYDAIAKELHDNICQLLGTARILISTTEVNHPGKMPASLYNAKEVISKAIQEIRIISKGLNSEWVKQFDLLDNLQSEIDRIKAAGIMKVELKCSEKNLSLEPDKQLVIFRVIQESLHNALKHSQAKAIDICIDLLQDCLLIRVIDDGTGFVETQDIAQGTGMLNMKHRVKLLNGVITWESLQKGTVVTIRLPLP